MQVVITGGAGFLGSHLADHLIARGDGVIAVDDLSTGRKQNVSHLPIFDLEIQDVAECMPYIPEHIDVVVHMASPASPPAYQAMPLHTLRTGSRGTENALKFAKEKRARFILASTSEVYGDPEIHPQPEGYFGNVNPIGVRSCYDEAKRFSEALTAAYWREGMDVGIIRIFNTYGPRMRADDGRVVTNFIVQALTGQSLTVNGTGFQTRSLCYVDDLIDGIIRMIDSPVTGPVNLGNPEEVTVNELASTVAELAGVKLSTSQCQVPSDDPWRRKPDISLAEGYLGWKPKTDLVTGLTRTIRWFRARPTEVEEAAQKMFDSRM